MESARGVASISEQMEVTTVPYTSAKAPNSSPAGFHQEEVKTFHPLCLAASHACQSNNPTIHNKRAITARGHCLQNIEIETIGVHTFHVTTHTPTKNCDKSKVSARNLGQIGGKQTGATEACSLHVARSDSVADPQDGLKCEQLPFHQSSWA